jgi:hypothetical protein
VFVDEHGSAYARFRRAVDRGNETAALSAAAELGRLGLSDGLELCLVLRRDSPRYEKAIVRWTARYVSEYHVSLDEAQAVLSLLATARDEPYALSALGDLLHRRRGLERVAKVLIRAAREGS